MAHQGGVLLITGTSCVGKTTLARMLAERLSAKVLHTDKMARHPGRPWPRVKPFIADYYGSLADETIFKLLEIHHHNMWPSLERLILSLAEGDRLAIVEGCALRPELMAPRLGERVRAVCLVADKDFITSRIKMESSYQSCTDDHKRIIDAFIARSLVDGDQQAEQAKTLGVPCLRVDRPGATDHFVQQLLEKSVS